MADILIRGMAKMPGNCRECMFAGFGGMRNELNVCMFSGESQSLISHERMSKCPLIPLPAGHGRLVDAREVLEKADKASWFDGDVPELGLLLGSEVTTIVPAEGGLRNE